MNSVTTQPQVLFTPAEAAEQLKVRESWLRRGVQARSIPHRKVGKHLRFSADDIAAIAAAAAQPAVPITPARRRAS